jgi:hypothetical protein
MCNARALFISIYFVSKRQQMPITGTDILVKYSTTASSSGNLGAGTVAGSLTNGNAHGMLWI